MIADPGTRSAELYPPAVEVLPEDASGRGAATDLEADGALPEGSADPFAHSREQFEVMLSWLSEAESDGLEHSELEERLVSDGRELKRRMLQDKLELRAFREARLDEVADSAGVARAAVEPGHERVLSSVFGQVTVRRMAYRHRGCENLYVADVQLNLPKERPSHGVRRLAAVESSKGSFEEATCQVREVTGLELSKRQIEELARAAAVDFDDFYASQARSAADGEDLDDVLVISCDGKGIVMRPDGLRPQTAAAAQRASPKLTTRLSRGEKRNRSGSPRSAQSTRSPPRRARPSTCLRALRRRPSQRPRPSASG
jgi:hypothetical protein